MSLGYLTTVRVTSVARLLRDHNGYHAFVSNLFGAVDHGRRYLFRAERRRLIIVSRAPPRSLSLDYAEVETESYGPVVVPGDVVRLSVRGNVVRRLSGRRLDAVLCLKRDLGTAREPMTDREVQCAAEDWVRSRAALAGLSGVTSVASSGYARGAYWWGPTRPPDDKMIRISSIDIDFTATVENAVQLRAAFLDGFGSGKSLGCGLLTLESVNGS